MLRVSLTVLALGVGLACATPPAGALVRFPEAVPSEEISADRSGFTGEAGKITGESGGAATLTLPELYGLALHVTADRRFARQSLAVVPCEAPVEWVHPEYDPDEFRVDPAAVGDGGEARGLYQVWARFWGRVPATAAGQIRQTYGIWLTEGWRWWSCRP